MSIINSILDNDLYKFTMQQAVLACFPNVSVCYNFINRGTHKFTHDFVEALKEQINRMHVLKLQDDEYLAIRKLPEFTPWYVQYIRNYCFDPRQVKVSIDANDGLDIKVKGPWHQTVLWEVPLMSIISELYFKTIDTNWNMEGQEDKARQKGEILEKNSCTFSDFGTRRRRSFLTQAIVVNELRKFNGFSGTSNVFLAQKCGLKAVGTCAHEWTMAISALVGLRHANFFAMQKWQEIYQDNLIALSDTFTSDMFLKDFDKILSNSYYGTRQDSGCPFEYSDKIISHYEKYGIDPRSKLIVFSDGLDVGKVVEIKKHCENRIRSSFGIGTNLTNDFGSLPLNIVIKLWEVDSIPVVKLSDSPGKAMGDADAVKVANWTFFGHLIERIKK